MGMIYTIFFKYDDVEDDSARRVVTRMIMLMLRKMRWRLMMLRMMRSRRGKMMMLRMMVLRRRTDPKTGDHTLCEPAQSKCTWTFHKSHLYE